MSHQKFNHSDEPIRIFKSNFLEFFTHISPITVVVLWLPVSIFFMVKAFTEIPEGQSGLFIPVVFSFALILWSFTEYIMHRFVFHFKAKPGWQERISFMFHGVHHAQPQLKTRLVMPPAVSIPLALLFYGLFYLLFVLIFRVPHWLAPLFSGFMIGYLIYDIMHYATHHFPMRNGYWKYIKRYHNQHHYKTPDQRFGVSSPVWDHFFGTFPKDQGKQASQ